MSWYQINILSLNGLLPGAPTAGRDPCLKPILHLRLQNRDFFPRHSFYVFRWYLLLQKELSPHFYFLSTASSHYWW